MKTEEEITRSLESNQAIIKTYQKHLKELTEKHHEHPLEVSRLISATDRGIRRLERENKYLNKELQYHIDDNAGEPKKAGD